MFLRLSCDALDLKRVVEQGACGTLDVDSQQEVSSSWLGSSLAPPGYRSNCSDWLHMCSIASNCKMYAKCWWTWAADLT